MKVQKHIEEAYQCNECAKRINEKQIWYRISYNGAADFCSWECANKYRDHMYKIVTHSSYDDNRVIGNTD